MEQGARAVATERQRRVTAGIERPARLRRAQGHLRRVDPMIGRLIDLQPDDDPRAWLDDLPPMHLFGSLRREDIVLPGDLALPKAIRTADQLDHLPSQDEVLETAEKWRPFRSIATSYLFASGYESDPASATS
jgi:hypothetical protein